MAKLDVVCFGEILWDIFEDPKTRGRNEPIGRVLLRELGGAPANVSVGLARMGLRSAVVGGIGSDPFGDALEALLAREGVHTKLLLRYPSRTGLTFVIRDARGEPNFLFYRDRTADMAPRPRDITPAMGRARWVLFGTSTLMEEGLLAATMRLRETARAERASVVVDLNVRAHLWKSARKMKQAIAALIEDADLVKASAEDLKAVGGWRWVRLHAPRATLVMTGGAGAARAIGAHGDVEARTRPARCVDATGAGDAFLAGLLGTLVSRGARPGTAAWKSPQVFVRALEVGHMLGRKAISMPGAIPGLVDLGEAKRVMRRS